MSHVPQPHGSARTRGFLSSLRFLALRVSRGSLARHASTRHFQDRVQITFASRLYGEGIGLAAIQQLLGHRWLSTTVRYVHVADEAIENAYQQAAERAAARFKEA